MDTYRTDLADTREGFDALAGEWRRLHAECGRRNPFLGFEWTAACRAHAEGCATPFVVTAWRGKRLAGVAPLRRERRLGFRMLRFIGDGRSDYLGFLTAPDCPDADQALLRGLEERRAHWDLALLRQLCGEYTGLGEAAAPGALRDRTAAAPAAPYLAFAGGWEELLADGPGPLRRGRKAARVFERDGGSVERTTGAAAADLVEELALVERESWKARRGIYRFQPGSGAEVARAALAALGAREEMEVWLARMGGRPAAFLVHFLTPGKVWFYQGAYSEQFRRYSPGQVLHYHSLRRAWENGAREYDFLTGEEPYKSEWTDRSRPLRHRALFPDAPRGYLAYALLVAPGWRMAACRPARAARLIRQRLRAGLLPRTGAREAQAAAGPPGA